MMHKLVRIISFGYLRCCGEPWLSFVQNARKLDILTALLGDYLVGTPAGCVAVRILEDTIATNVDNRTAMMLAELQEFNQTAVRRSPQRTGSFAPGPSTSNLYSIA